MPTVGGAQVVGRGDEIDRLRGLAKLGVTSRVELAAQVVRRTAAPV
jgi:hypothetical protein